MNAKLERLYTYLVIEAILRVVSQQVDQGYHNDYKAKHMSPYIHCLIVELYDGFYRQLVVVAYPIACQEVELVFHPLGRIF